MPKEGTRRTANGSGSIYKRSDGRWEARYTVGTDTGTGKQIRKSVYGNTQKEVKQKLTQAIAAIDNGEYFEPSKTTVANWVKIWLEEYCGDKKWSTVKHYKAQCRTHIIPKLGAVKLSALTTPQIQKFYNGLQAEGLSPKSVRNIHGILTKCLSTAVSVGYIKNNPASLAIIPKVIKKEIRPLTDEQVKLFMTEADSDEYATLLKVILFTGLRESEAIGLTWDCIDFKTGLITVSKQLQKRPLSEGGFVFVPLKNSKTRIIQPAPFVMNMLKQRKIEQYNDFFAAGWEVWQAWKNEKEQASALVFTTKLGEHLQPQTVYNHYKKIAARIGADESRVHDLRHTFAVLSLQNGDDIKTVQDNLGHATAAFTLDVYGHVSEQMKAASAARMEAYISSVANA